MSARRQFGFAVAAVLATCCLSACTGSHPAAPGRHAPAQDARAPRPAMTLQIMPAPYQLPAAVSREVLLPGRGRAADHRRADPVRDIGQHGDRASTRSRAAPARPGGWLRPPTTPRASSWAGGRFVLGGGTASSVPTVQAFTPGTPATVTGAMSRARSDSGGVSAGPAGYVIGGYDGTRLDPEVLATRDGLHFRVAARLPVPVRYAAMAAGRRPDLGVRRPDGGRPDRRHPADQPGHRRGRRGRPPAAAGPGCGRAQPGRAGLRRGRGPGPGTCSGSTRSRPG